MLNHNLKKKHIHNLCTKWYLISFDIILIKQIIFEKKHVH